MLSIECLQAPSLSNENERTRLPKEGLLRLMLAHAIAYAAPEAYASDRLHWYVPSELSDHDAEVTRRPETEATRDRWIAGGF